MAPILRHDNQAEVSDEISRQNSSHQENEVPPRTRNARNACLWALYAYDDSYCSGDIFPTGHGCVIRDSDPVATAAHIVVRLQTRITKEVRPEDFPSSAAPLFMVEVHRTCILHDSLNGASKDTVGIWHYSALSLICSQNSQVVRNYLSLQYAIAPRRARPRTSIIVPALKA